MFTNFTSYAYTIFVDVNIDSRTNAHAFFIDAQANIKREKNRIKTLIDKIIKNSFLVNDCPIFELFCLHLNFTFVKDGLIENVYKKVV